ncbi:hypothetical protein AVEN_233205-1, partial [Araneus ventricosus]
MESVFISVQIYLIWKLFMDCEEQQMILTLEDAHTTGTKHSRAVIVISISLDCHENGNGYTSGLDSGERE